MALSDCHWPALPAPYSEALHEAVELVVTEFRPVGIVAAGSVVRGAGDPRSDIDLLVIHTAAFRQRLQRRYAGVPVEIFVNPPDGVREIFLSEHRRARPTMARMLATGFVVQDGAALGELRQEAAQWLDKRSAPTADEDIWACYQVATMLEDAEDVRPRDPAMAAVLLSEAITAGLRHWLHVRDGVLPGSKGLLAKVREADTELGSLSDQLFGAADIDLRIRLARQIAQRCVGAVGFFEWDSARLPVPGRHHEGDRATRAQLRPGDGASATAAETGASAGVVEDDPERMT
jgi:predicted nucleotidyltransferase